MVLASFRLVPLGLLSQHDFFAVIPEEDYSAEEAHEEHGIKIKPRTVELDEDGVRISLTVVETPGFANDLNNEYAYANKPTDLQKRDCNLS